MISIRLVFLCVVLVCTTLFVCPLNAQYTAVISVGKYSDYYATTQCPDRPQVETDKFVGISVPNLLAQQIGASSICGRRVQVTYNTRGPVNGEGNPLDVTIVALVADICPAAGCAGAGEDPNTILLTAEAYNTLGVNDPTYANIPVVYKLL